MANTAGLEPIGKCVLVQVGQQYEHAATPDKKWDQRTNGILVSFSNDLTDDQQSRIAPFVGKRVYWESFNADSQVSKDNVQYAFVKYKDLMGVDLAGQT